MGRTFRVYPTLTNRADRARIIGALLWALVFYLSLGGLVLHNDHFDRISRARQLARFGELPFRDFFDPGYFGSVLASAALQRLLGDNLLGELLLNAAFIATGTVLVLYLATRLSRSLPIGVAAALLALLTMPRAYDYDKVLFFPLGVALCWRYLDTRRPRDLVMLAIALVCGAVFRYDTGVYVGGGAIATLVAAHAPDWRTMARRAGLWPLRWPPRQRRRCSSWPWRADCPTRWTRSRPTRAARPPGPG